MLTQEELKKLLHYDPETGFFTHLTTRNNGVKIGQRAGAKHTDLSDKSYIVVCLNGKHYRAHRLIWLYVHGVFPEYEIDHEDGDGTNNTLINLRAATGTENAKNRRIARNNTTGVMGVTWHKECRKWCVRVGHGGERIYLGLFETLLDAVCARKNAEVIYGYHPGHNTVRPL